MKNICVLKRDENTEIENDFYINAIKKYGGNPILIDNNNVDNIYNCSGILITGGDKKGELDDYLIKYALDNNLPLLGICQGMQSMALYDTNEHLEKVNNHYQKEGYVHKVYLKDSKLGQIIKNQIIHVNSHHNETPKTSKIFSIVGKSDDNLIEALENSKHKFQIGVQWHPERMINYDFYSNKLFKEFINACK